MKHGAVMDPAIQRLIEYLDGSWVHAYTIPDPRKEREEIYKDLMQFANRLNHGFGNSDGYLILMISLDFISVLHLVENSIMKYPSRMVFKTDIKDLQQAMGAVLTNLDICIHGPKRLTNIRDLELASLDLECICFKMFILHMEDANITYMSLVTCVSTTMYDDIRKLKNYINCWEE